MAPSRWLLAGLAAPLILAFSARADSPAWERSDEAARARLTRVASAYKALEGYEDHGEFRRSLKLGDRERTDKTPLSLKFARPDHLVLDAGEVRLLADGKTLTTVLVPTRRYMITPSAGRLDLTAIADGPAGAILLGGASGPPSQLLLKLLAGLEPASALPDRATRLKDEPDVQRDGRTYQALRVELGDEPPLRVLIDPGSNLIRRMEYVLEPKSASDRLPKSVGEVSDLEIAWDSGEIRTGSVDPSAFRFSAPKEFEKMQAPVANPAKPKEPAERGER